MISLPNISKMSGFSLLQKNMSSLKPQSKSVIPGPKMKVGSLKVHIVKNALRKHLGARIHEPGLGKTFSSLNPTQSLKSNNASGVHKF